MGLLADLMAGAVRRLRPDHRLADPAAGLRAADRRRGLRPARGHARRRPGHADSAVHHRRGGWPDRCPPYRGSGLPYRRRSTSELLRARSQVLGGLEVSYAAAGASRGRPRSVPRGRGRAPLPRCVQQRAGARTLSPGGRRRRLLAAGHAEHQQPLPAGGSRRAGRTTVGDPPGSVRPRSARELRQRGERPGLAHRAARHRCLGRYSRPHGPTTASRRRRSRFLRRVGATVRPHHTCGWWPPPPLSPDGGGLCRRQPGRQWPWGGGDVRRRCVHQRRDPRAGSRVDRRGGSHRARGGRTVRRRRGAGRARQDRRRPVELLSRPGAG